MSLAKLLFSAEDDSPKPRTKMIMADATTIGAQIRLYDITDPANCVELDTLSTGSLQYRHAFEIEEGIYFFIDLDFRYRYVEVSGNTLINRGSGTVSGRSSQRTLGEIENAVFFDRNRQIIYFGLSTPTDNIGAIDVSNWPSAPTFQFDHDDGIYTDNAYAMWADEDGILFVYSQASDRFSSYDTDPINSSWTRLDNQSTSSVVAVPEGCVGWDEKGVLYLFGRDELAVGGIANPSNLFVTSAQSNQFSDETVWGYVDKERELLICVQHGDVHAIIYDLSGSNFVNPVKVGQVESIFGRNFRGAQYDQNAGILYAMHQSHFRSFDVTQSLQTSPVMSWDTEINLLDDGDDNGCFCLVP